MMYLLPDQRGIDIRYLLSNCDLQIPEKNENSADHIFDSFTHLSYISVRVTFFLTSLALSHLWYSTLTIILITVEIE